jgi:hypothetical protein
MARASSRCAITSNLARKQVQNASAQNRRRGPARATLSGACALWSGIGSFDQASAPGVQREQRVGVVKIVQRDAGADIAAVITDQRLSGALCRPDPAARREGRRFRQIARTDGGDPLCRLRADRADNLFGDPAGAEDAPTDRGRVYRR